MRVTLIDDTIPFDGNTAQLQPLGGAEKAFAGLAGGLGRSNHEVQVFNRCLHRLIADRPAGAHQRNGDMVPVGTSPFVLGRD